MVSQLTQQYGSIVAESSMTASYSMATGPLFRAQMQLAIMRQVNESEAFRCFSSQARRLYLNTNMGLYSEI